MNRIVSIVEKAGMFGLISLETKPETTILSNYDPRGPSAYVRAFGDPEEARRFFDESLAVTRDRGWNVTWTGTPSWG